MKPILFNAEMVKAILDGHKSMTRRVIKPRYKDDEYGFNVITNKATGGRWVEKYDGEYHGGTPFVDILFDDGRCIRATSITQISADGINVSELLEVKE